MADLTPVAGTGVTDAFCYRERRWRTDSLSGKGEARRIRQRDVEKDLASLSTHSLSPLMRSQHIYCHQYIKMKVETTEAKWIKHHKKKRLSFISNHKEWIDDPENYMSLFWIAWWVTGLYVCLRAPWHHHVNAFVRQLYYKAKMLHISQRWLTLFVVRAPHFSQSSHSISLDNTTLITCVMHVQDEWIWLGVAHMGCQVHMDGDAE